MSERRVALSNFYREEFLRHIEHLQATGILDDGESEAVSRAHKVLRRLDDVCSLEAFPVLAETLLQNFETLTGLSRLDPHHRQRH
jgi:hypothetical protein